MNFGSRIIAGARRRAQSAYRHWSVARNARHLSGPTRITLQDGDCAVVSLMKDAEYFVGPFIRHHQALGAKHILIVDNGSSDNTVAIASGFAGVTIIRNTLPARLFECRLRSQTARSVFQGGWLLFVDSDELFDIPVASGPALPRLTGYLNAHGYTAMVTQMLDLYAAAPYHNLKGLDYSATIAAFDTCSLSHITRLPYHDRTQVLFNWFLQANDCADPAVKLQIGGLRTEVFGETPFLSKHSLVRNLPQIDLMPHPHCAMGVRVADVTGLLRHYKLAGAYMDRDRRSVAARTWDHDEDRRRVSRTQDRDGFAITCADPQPFRGTGPLLDQGFLTASDRYRAFMAAP